MIQLCTITKYIIVLIPIEMSMGYKTMIGSEKQLSDGVKKY